MPLFGMALFFGSLSLFFYGLFGSGEDAHINGAFRRRVIHGRIRIKLVEVDILGSDIDVLKIPFRHDLRLASVKTHPHQGRRRRIIFLILDVGAAHIKGIHPVRRENLHHVI